MILNTRTALYHFLNFLLISTLAIPLSLMPPSTSVLAAKNENSPSIQTSGKERHPLDSFRLLLQRVFLGVVHEEPIRETIRIGEMSFSGFNSSGEFIASDAMDENSSGSIEVGRNGSFDVFYKDRLVHRFDNVRNVIFFDNNLVFVGDDSLLEESETAQIFFIDLSKYAQSVGRTELPVFRVPVALGKGLSEIKLSIENGRLVTTGRQSIKLSKDVFAELSKIQEVGLNIAGSLSNPETFEETSSLVSEINLVFNRAVEFAGVSNATHEGIEESRNEVVAHLNNSLKQKAGRPNEINSTESARDYLASILTDKRLVNVLATHTKAQSIQESLMARIRMLWTRFSIPAFSHITSIKNALIATATVNSGFLTVAGLVALNMPYSEFMLQNLDLVETVFSTVWGPVHSFGNLSYQTASATIEGFNPYVIHEAYIEGDKLGRLCVGMTAAFSTLIISLGTPHLIINTIKLLKDLELVESVKSGPRAILNFAGSFRAKFISRQNEREAEYLQALANSDGNSDLALKQVTFTEEQEREIDELILNLEKNQSRFVGALKRFCKRIPLLDKLSSRRNTDHTLNSFAGALTHFLFSACSFTQSGAAYAKIWNGWFMFRSVVFRPVILGTFLLYPNYFRVLTQSDKKPTLPTHYNGGLRPAHLEWANRARAFFGNESLRLLKSFEQSILPIEEEIHKACLEKAFHALLEFVDDSKTFDKLISTRGVDSLNNDTLNQISSRNRRFFQVYYMNLFNAAMKKYLTDLNANDAAVDASSSNGNIYAAVNLNSDGAKALVRNVAQSEGILDKSKASFNRITSRLRQLPQSLDLNNFRVLDPKKNRQIARFKSVNRQAKNPQAMARAVRGTIASIVVDKPLELLLLIVCLAGIDAGINQPLHEDMFGPNSWFYLGRYPFFTGYVSSLLMQVLSNIWMKLQQDEMHEGSFGERPEDKNSSYISWYWKQMRSKKNSTWENQKHYIKIIWANMPAALVTFIATNVLTLGRLDLDTYLTGYMLAYLLPTNGLAFQVEQSFELAAGYFKKDIPEDYDRSPKVQKYLDQRLSRARIWFNVYYKTYENILGFYLGNLQTLETPELGSRSLSRFIFGGYTPTELAIKFIDQIESSVSWVPGASSVTSACRNLFSNNYTDGDLL